MSALEYEVKVSAYLLELLNSTLVDTSALVDQVAYNDEYVMAGKDMILATHRW